LIFEKILDKKESGLINFGGELMELNEQLKNIRYADFAELIRMDESCIFDLYNLLKRLEEFFPSVEFKN